MCQTCAIHERPDMVPGLAMSPKKTAVILTHLGNPHDNTRTGVRAFLKPLLSDRRVLEIPALIRWFVVHLWMLPHCSKSVLQACNRIWGDEGSPLLAISRRQKMALQRRLGDDVLVDVMMRYGEPSIESVLNDLVRQGYNRFVILPLFPQNSATSSATTQEHIARLLKRTRNVPEFTLVSDYHADPAYILALVASVQQHWKTQRRQRFLLMSFHGLPQSAVDHGDPYYDQCMGTAHLLATMLGLGGNQWGIGFQSRFGMRQWLRPDTSETLQALARNRLREIDVICPGFAADCLETLDEIQLRNRQVFLDAGGEQYHYIPCLNDRNDHIDMMADLLRPHLEPSG